MATELFFGKDEFIIDGNFKATAGRWNEFPIFDEVFDGTFFQDFVRQTDGAGGVVSSRTVFNGDGHQSVLHRGVSLIIIGVYNTSSTAGITT